MFHLDGNLILALYPRTELAKDAGMPLGPPKSGEFSIGHLVASSEDVDALLARAEAAGATSPGHRMTARGASTRGTFATSTGTSGRSSGILAARCDPASARLPRPAQHCRPARVAAAM